VTVYEYRDQWEHYRRCKAQENPISKILHEMALKTADSASLEEALTSLGEVVEYKLFLETRRQMLSDTAKKNSYSDALREIHNVINNIVTKATRIREGSNDG
jgi:type II secretory pathway component PulF